MLLLSTQTAFRGESARILLWSDLFPTSVPMDDIQLGMRVPVRALPLPLLPALQLTSLSPAQVFAALADNAKHNQMGRVDEHGALRHRVTELCGVGALAMLFFAHFHIMARPVPDFSPNFEGPDSGEYGHRPWYKYHVFYSTARGGDPEQPMSYDSQ